MDEYTTWARVEGENKQVVEVVYEAPQDRYHPSLEFHPVSAQLALYIDNEYFWDGAEFQALQGPGYTLEKARKMKLDTINTEYERRLTPVTQDTPLDEVLTWDRQQLEVEAWLKKNNILDVELLAIWRKDGLEAVKARMTESVPLPFLEQLSRARQMDLTELSMKVVDKVHQFILYSGQMTGIRQRLEDQIKAAQTVEEVMAVAWPS